jgi:glycosyltransferase involved in cell wall biosynthesis
LNRTTGFNVVGYLSGNLGLGVAARHVARLILDRKLPLAVVDLDPGFGRGGHDQEFLEYAVTSPEALPYEVTIFVLPPPTVFALMEDSARRWLLLRRDGIRAALLFWEQAKLSRKWLPALQTLDVVVAPSHFVGSVCTSSLDGMLTIPAVFPFRLPDVSASRQRFQLPSDLTVFVTSFEPLSDPERKNPLAAIKAFQCSFPNDRDAMLVIRVNNPIVERSPHPIVTRLRDECSRDSRIRLIEEFLTYQEVLTLYASCDVFISLHRSEGLGFGLMEAMAMGKPVIATAWSGNMTYMNSVNSCLVGFQLVPVKTSNREYTRGLGPDARWADPNIEDAAAWMKRLVAEPALRTDIGGRAAEAMRAHQREANRGAFLDELAAIAEHLEGMPSFQSRKARLLDYEQRLRRGDKRRAVWARIERLLDRHVLWRMRGWSKGR